MILVLAEKPSVAQDIARVIGANQKNSDGYWQGNGYIVFNFLGHLVELASASDYDEKYAKWNMEDLPIIPQPFKYLPLKDKAEHLNRLKKLINSSEVDSLICATDAGREGEVIFRYVYDYIGCKKPYKRLWISSLTDESISQGFKNLSEGKENLYQSGATRAQIDWLVGINLSRLYSLYFQTKLSIGRVQTATLNLIVQRDLDIANFTRKPYYKLLLENGAEWFTDDNDSFETKSEAQAVLNECEGQLAAVVQAEKKKKTENRPILYSLTTLQIDANDSLGYSAAQTLNIMQSLYEKKLLTYPRTESNYLTDDMKSEIPVIMQLLTFYDADRVKHFDEIGLNLDSRVFDNSKVSDHHAIIPTKEIKKAQNLDLSSEEKSILDLVIKRFFLAFEQPYIYNETAYIFTIGDHSFKLNVKEPVSLGWKAYSSEKKSDEVKEPVIYEKGDKFVAQNLEIKECETTPPKPFTESSLLSAMENVDKRIEDKELRQYVKARGLGTTATRAAIIERILSLEYVARDKKTIRSTAKGRYLIEHIPDEIKNVELTANMESQLVAIENGEEKPEKVIANAVKLVCDVMDAEKNKPHESMRTQAAKEAIGKCPKCGGNVYEGKKNWYCENYKADKPCNFTIWKDDMFFSARKKTLTTDIVRKVLEKGKVLLKGCYSEKSQKTYDAYVGLGEYTAKDGTIKTGFKILEFKNNSSKGGKTE